jgi:hypothetical protein
LAKMNLKNGSIEEFYYETDINEEHALKIFLF